MTTTESLLPELINDFCNKIGTTRKSAHVRGMSAFGGKSGLDMLTLSSSGLTDAVEKVFLHL
jgi:hypothetical protein